jgi:DNA-directed RNA polymerase sigma subunit (sigma70/sigma32)
MKPSPIKIVLTESERQELERRSRSLTAPHREVVRAKVILGLAAGRPLMRLESELQLTRKIIRKCRAPDVGTQNQALAGPYWR